MRLQYDTGPEKVSMGAAGEFKRGEAKEVSDELATALLKKEVIKFTKIAGRQLPPALADNSQIQETHKKKEG